MQPEAVVEPAPCAPGAPSWAPCVTVNDCADIRLLRNGRCDRAAPGRPRSDRLGQRPGDARRAWGAPAPPHVPGGRPAARSAPNAARARPGGGPRAAGCWPRTPPAPRAARRARGRAPGTQARGGGPGGRSPTPPLCTRRAPPCRFSAVHVASCAAAGGRVAIKVYDKPALSSRKRNMATREAIILKHLNACGWVAAARGGRRAAGGGGGGGGGRGMAGGPDPARPPAVGAGPGGRRPPRPATNRPPAAAPPPRLPFTPPPPRPTPALPSVPYVPRLWSAYAGGSQFHLIQQFFGGGDLLAALQARGGRGFPEHVVAQQVPGAPWGCHGGAGNRRQQRAP
jgi:hypothetical protein